MTELVLLAEFPVMAAAASEARAIAKRLGDSPVVKRCADGWGLFASHELANRIRGDATFGRAPKAPLVKPSAPAASIGPSSVPVRARVEPTSTAPTSRLSESARLREPPARVWSMSGDEARHMAAELRHAYSRFSEAHAKEWLRCTLERFPTMIGRRVGNLAGTVVNVAEAVGEEIAGLVRAIWQQRAVDHMSLRMSHGARKATEFVKSSHARMLPLVTELKNDPANVAPDLFVAALAFYVSGGGFDGDGGIPDTDIPLLGIGAHRSIFTHSIIAGAVVETALYSLLDFVAIGYGHLPAGHDRRWTVIHERLERATDAGAKGMSMGLAYHLGVDGLVQPGAYHDLPIELSMAGHQTILAANAATEGLDASHKESQAKLQPEASAASAKEPPAAQTAPGKLKNILVGAAALAALAAQEFLG